MHNYCHQLTGLTYPLHTKYFKQVGMVGTNGPTKDIDHSAASTGDAYSNCHTHWL